MEIFVGSPVYLRPLDRQHLPNSLQWFYEDKDVLRFLNWELPLNNRLTEEHWLTTVMASPQNHVFAVIDSESGVHIGNIGVHNINLAAHSGEVGVYIAPEWRGRGLGEAALTKLIDWCFDVRNLHRLELRVWSYNDRAKRCYQRLGLSREGILRDAHYMEGRYWDVEIWGLLKNEWGRRAEAGPAIPDKCWTSPGGA